MRKTFAGTSRQGADNDGDALGRGHRRARGRIPQPIFRRDGGGRVTGLSVSQDHVWDLRFNRTVSGGS